MLDEKAVEIKGVALAGTIAYIKREGGDAAWSQTLALLPAETRRKLGTAVLPSSFYPLAWLVELQKRGIEVLGGDLDTRLREIGRFAGQSAFTGVYKLFVKLGSPEFLLGRADRIFSNYYRGTDIKMKVLEIEKGRGRLEFPPLPGGHRDYCRRLDGFFEILLELSGAEAVRVVHSSCSFRGSEVCEWMATWR